MLNLCLLQISNWPCWSNFVQTLASNFVNGHFHFSMMNHLNFLSFFALVLLFATSTLIPLPRYHKEILPSYRCGHVMLSIRCLYIIIRCIHTTRLFPSPHLSIHGAMEPFFHLCTHREWCGWRSLCLSHLLFSHYYLFIILGAYF